MKKILLSAILLLSTVVSAAPWMPWDNNTNDSMMGSWNPFGNSGANWNPMNSGSNFGPFNSGSSFNPFDGGSNLGPFNKDQNWGPLSNVNEMVNDSDWGFHYNNKNSMSNKGYSRADGKYTTKLEARGVGYSDAYTKGNADAYYKGQLDGYGKARGSGRFEGYGQKGHLGFAPVSSNDFPAPNN
ncbi:hypothetical protein [Candidatus Thioglobus sp.]|uniref:hypothetical protein n=1 Tax=Candidatus Thioglobus sp. TaxID=2026721 RepID=UPI003D09C480